MISSPLDKRQIAKGLLMIALRSASALGRVFLLKHTTDFCFYLFFGLFVDFTRTIVSSYCISQMPTELTACARILSNTSRAVS